MTIIEQAQKIRTAKDVASKDLADARAIELSALFKLWQEETAYTVGDRCRHGNLLYSCVQAHTSQAGWEPPSVPALWRVISVDEYPAWVRPTGAQDAYSIGDKVTYQGKKYVSTINGNTWSPTEYPAGWQSV